MGQSKMLCNEVETVRQFTYLGGTVISGEGCEAAVTARARFGLGKFMECGEVGKSCLQEICKVNNSVLK